MSAQARLVLFLVALVATSDSAWAQDASLLGRLTIPLNGPPNAGSKVTVEGTITDNKSERVPSFNPELKIPPIEILTIELTKDGLRMSGPAAEMLPKGNSKGQQPKGEIQDAPGGQMPPEEKTPKNDTKKDTKCRISITGAETRKDCE